MDRFLDMGTFVFELLEVMMTKDMTEFFVHDMTAHEHMANK